jgi:hypothetical protein
MAMPYLQKVTLKCCDTFNDNGPLYLKMIILLPFARLGYLDTKLTYNVITTIRIRSPRALRIVIGRFHQATTKRFFFVRDGFVEHISLT